MSPRAPLLDVGDEIGPYRTRKLLGQGLEGDVFLAIQKNTRELATIKVLRGRNMEPEVRKAEAYYQSLTRLRAVKQWLGYGVLGSQPGVGTRHYAVSEYIAGHTLHELMAGNRPPEPLTTVDAVCTALAKVHRRHRTIGDFDQGRNVLIRAEDGSVVFIDLDWTSRWSARAVEIDLHELLRLLRALHRANGIAIRAELNARLKAAKTVREFQQMLRA